ncbi:IS110 family transposase [Mesorhizobium sp. M00.F.Ca.ET.186.01.1.1]|nr:IS110 family transposase [bacterium M00.F.Ca.ET.205.01.1.1]TGU54788.1 IS110 family transposase [bacterium M00.F.Ca.ET.152.01.1.1]TGV38438.1 IS110 family transposase [Mesorhizobium sp. M00.F.Ca.ET.186.01.1.1]TGZ44360.1 IS110 family transposase [bacterium M00.F.Ca.ET.162.01.1.1]TIW61053.1 MAG: IS110 family transposase [Mesorhizobium sp.]
MRHLQAVARLFDEASGHSQRIDNQADAIAAYVAGLHPDRDFVVMEATGVHDRLLRHALAKAGIAFSRHNPAHTHHYAKSTRRRAKTDRLDARMLSSYGRRYHPEAEPVPREEGEHLQSLARHRDHLVEMRAKLKKLRSEAFDAVVIDDLEDMIASCDTRIKAIESRLAEAIRQSEETARDNALMVSVPGVSKVTAFSLLAHLPELGLRSPKSIAALAGLAPFDNKSGKLNRRSQIQGGRSRVRRALYMAALGAIRACERFRDFYTAIAARSGSKKLAIIAVARKLLVVLNAIIRDKKAFA